MAKSFGEALATGQPVVLTFPRSSRRVAELLYRPGQEKQGLELLGEMGVVKLVDVSDQCICPPECHDEACPVCIPKGEPAPASVTEAIDGLYRIALDAIDYVGQANYQTRQNEAAKRVEAAYYALQCALNVYRHAK